jgi:hypothetical protein
LGRERDVARANDRGVGVVDAVLIGQHAAAKRVPVCVRVCVGARQSFVGAVRHRARACAGATR